MSSSGDREPPLKRYRRREEERRSDDDDFEKEGDDYVPYVSVRSGTFSRPTRASSAPRYIMHIKIKLRWRGMSKAERHFILLKLLVSKFNVPFR